MYPKFVRDDEQQNFAKLVKAYQQNKLIPYVGAGFSIHDDACPGWGQFLNDLCEANLAVLKPKQVKKFKQYFDDYDYESALALLVEVIGKPQFHRQVESKFAKPCDWVKPAEFVIKFSLFHQVFKGPWFTTNLDRFIEDSYPKSAADLTVVRGCKDDGFTDALNRGDLTGYLFKLHGDAKSPQSLVFERQQYIDAYGHDDSFDLNTKLPQFLARIYQNNSLLFIGCSLSIDRPLMVLEQLAAEGGVKPQFALVLREHFQGDNNVDNLKRLMHLDITSIYLDDFSDIELVFEHLLSLSGAVDEEQDTPIPDVFVGREKPLKTLMDNVSQAGSVLTITEDTTNLNYLSGLGGIGKTTLARQVLHNCGHLFDACFEIRIDSISPMAFAKALADRLGDSRREFNLEDAKTYIKHQLNAQRLLILLDNVDKGQVLLDLLPDNYQSCLIVTSRDTHLKKLLKLSRKQLNLCAIELDKFSQDEALELFKQLLDDEFEPDQQDTYLAIAEKVDYHNFWQALPYQQAVHKFVAPVDAKLTLHLIAPYLPISMPDFQVT